MSDLTDCHEAAQADITAQLRQQRGAIQPATLTTHPLTEKARDALVTSRLIAQLQDICERNEISGEQLSEWGTIEHVLRKLVCRITTALE